MADESIFSENLDSRNRGGAEPKKKLKKRRSIRVSRVPSLKPRAKSRFDWPPSDLSRDASSLQQASSIALSDSAPNYMGFTSSFTAKKGGPQGGSECDDVNSVFSSSCGSSDRVVHPFISISDDATMPQHPSSMEVSDASPSYVEAKNWSGGKKDHFQASPCDSESSYDSNDRTKSSHTSESNSIYFSRKSLHNPLRTSSSSIRNVRVLVKKASFKPKRKSSKSSQISEDSHVDKATCSSIIKDSRFAKHVELQAGETEADRISFVKVCPYHRCSLNGHSHDPPPRKHSSHERRQSLKPQMSKKPSSVTAPKVKPAADKKEDVKKHQMNPNKEAPTQECTLVQREKVKAFYTEKGIILETRLGSYNMKMDVDQTISPDFGAELEGGESTASSVGARENNLTLQGENTDFPHTDSLELFKKLDNPVGTSCESDATLNRQPSENIPSKMVRNLTSGNIGEATTDERVISPVSDSHTSQDLRLSMEETNRNLKPDMALTAGFTPDGDSESKLQNPARDSEPPLSSEVQKSQLNKGKHISMWRLIHKHMASGIAAEDTTKSLPGADEEKKVEEAKTDPAKESSDAYLQPSYSDIGIESQETANQEIEIRKLFAIKLVREAIEKILLPEVQDQSSETQSITSDTIEEQEISEKNQQEAPGEGCHGGNGNNNRVGNTAADPRVLGHTNDSLSGQEEKKPQTKLGKKSDKQSPSNWSNLKKWILLQRFVKELEKVRKFNPSKPRHLQLETDPESEKVNLRHQTVDERRRAEEWMLDYALRQVVSELAPTQKKKVAVLVKAFETVVPPQEDRNIQITFPKLKDKSNEDAFITKKEDLSPTEMEDRKSHAEENNMGKPDGWERSLVPEGHCKAKGHNMPLDDDTQSSTDPCLKSDSTINSCKEVPRDAEYQQEAAANLIGDSEPINIAQHIVADTTARNMEHIAYSTLDQQVPEVNPEFPPMDLKIPDNKNESCQSQLDKQNYIRMWHMVYQHVASSIATKVGSQLLGGEDEEVEDAYDLSERDTSGLHADPANGSHDEVKEDHEASRLQSEFSRSDAVKLVQEAVNEILDDTSDTQSITSETSPDQELSENEHKEVETQSISSSTSLNKENINKIETEGGFSLDEEDGSKSESISTQQHERAESPDKIKPYPQKMKNWSKLKKLMLLKRSIKAMEKARELKSQSQKLLSLPSGPQPEKIDLRQQMMDERKKAEQWMLDYAVQHIVTKLTPARKRRVAMLVEAFEAVVPLPAV